MHDRLLPRQENFLIVVTYDELYLGNGNTFRSAIAPLEVDKLYSRPGASSDLPLSHIYFMSIAAFELLCQAVAHGSITLSAAMRRIRDADTSAATSKFDANLHLGSLGIPIKPYEPLCRQLDLEMDRLAEPLRTRGTQPG